MTKDEWTAPEGDTLEIEVEPCGVRAYRVESQ